jgi:hypothetical protein
MGCYPTQGHDELNSGPAATRLRRELQSDPPDQQAAARPAERASQAGGKSQPTRINIPL